MLISRIVYNVNKNCVFLTENGGGTNAKDIHTAKNPPRAQDDQVIGIIIGAITAFIILMSVIIVFCIIRNRRKKSKNQKLAKDMERQRVTLDLNQLRELTNGKASNGTLYSNSIHDDYLEAERQALMANFVNGKIANGLGNMYHQDSFDSGIQTRKLPELPALKVPESGTGNTRHDITRYIVHSVCILFLFVLFFQLVKYVKDKNISVDLLGFCSIKRSRLYYNQIGMIRVYCFYCYHICVFHIFSYDFIFPL